MSRLEFGQPSDLAIPRLDIHSGGAAPPRRSSLRPASIDTGRSSGYGHLQTVVPVSEMTPPLTPASYHSSYSQEVPASPSASIVELPAFHNYLRAFYPFHPAANVDSIGGEESSVIVPINQGDVILIHSVQPNGWADGTLLASGARGWLPTNYCEPYDHDAVRPLLSALTNVWEFIHGHDENESMVFARQDYVRGLIAGVRQFLDRVQCLSKDSPMVQQNSNIRRTRRGLLSELSSFAKAAKSLQEECQKDIEPESLLQLLDDAVLRAYQVVMRAVRLLDVWLHNSSPVDDRESLSQPLPAVRIMQPLTPPSEFQDAEGAENDCSHESSNSTTPRAHSTTEDVAFSGPHSSQDLSEDSNSHEASPAMQSFTFPATPSASGTVQPPPTLGPIAAHNRLSGVPSSASPAAASTTSITPTPTLTSTDVASSPHIVAKPSFRPPSTIYAPCVRPLSIAQKRASASHRLSHGPRAPVYVDGPLASERLSTTHDAFLSSLGAFVGLHLQSRSSMDLLMSTQQSVSSCQALLAVVDEIWERDYRRSEVLAQARQTMYSSLSELVQATRSLLQDPEDAGVIESIVADQGERLVHATTCCVRAAGDCIAKSKAVIERIGDFVLEQVGLSVPDSGAANDSSVDMQSQVPSPRWDQTSRQSSDSDDNATGDESASVAASEKTSTAGNSLTTEVADDFSQPPVSPMRPPPPPPHHPDADRLTPTPLNIPALSRASSDTVIAPEQLAAPSETPQHLSFDFEIPQSSLELINFPEPPKGVLSADSKPRTDSFGVSGSESMSTGQSSFRNSNTSLPSQTSTRATTPDTNAQQDVVPSTMTTSFTSVTDSQNNFSDEAEDGEAQLMATTYAHELIFNKDGQVSGGSLPALVEKLTTHDSTPDAQFVNAFYLTFRLFTTPVEFAQALVDRFDYVAELKSVATPVRLRVYNVFKGWLESHWSPASDANALKVILPFAIGRLRAALPSASQRLIDLTTKISDSKDGAVVPRLTSSVGKTSIAHPSPMGADASAPSPVVSKSQLNLLRQANSGLAICTVLDLDALEFARQLTLTEAKMYCAIQPEELLALEWMKKSGSKASNVKAMSAFSTCLAALVAESILQYDEPKKRAAMIKKWIKIEAMCLELKNYDSLLAIHCSLDSSTVHRLRKTWDLLPAKTMAKYQELKKVCDMSRNYVGLRQRLQNQVAPCIPFVGVYLTDLTFVDAGNQSMRQLPQDGSAESMSVINFDKHMKTAKIIGDLQRFQIHYKLSPVPEMQEWIDVQILRLKTDIDQTPAFYRRSCFLEPRENHARTSPLESVNTSFTSTNSAPSVISRESTKERFDIWSSLHFGGAGKEKNATN